MNKITGNRLPPEMGNSRIPLKITVIHRTNIEDINLPDGIAENAEKTCVLFRDGDSFLVTDRGGQPPRDFPCAWAWHDLYQLILGLQLGGNYPPFANGICCASCTSGLHPVFFKLERQ